MAHLQLGCLGPPEARLDEQALVFPTRKALALLVYLAVEGGLQPRPKLMTLFWPDSDTERGRSALRSTLAYLRRAFETVSPHSSHYFLQAEADGVGFNFEAAHELDIQVIEAAHNRRGFKDPDKLQRAIELYRGDFLEGFSLPDAPDFDDWLSLQRERWHRAMLQIFDQLSQAQLDTRHFGPAIATATRWIHQDPLDEAAHRRLMEIYALAGNKAAALQVYQSYRSTLQANLGVEPSPATEALARRIENSWRTRSPDSEASARQKSKPLSREAELPFVGRSTEYTRLSELFRQASSGQTHLVVIQGEAGIGKTRLVSEFLEGLTWQGADILQGRAFEAGGRLPYQPLVEALRQRLERENAPDDLLADVWLVELSRLLPELRERYPDLPPPTPDETLGRIRLSEALARLGKALARSQPLVFFLDDLQWADAASLDLLHYACRSWSSTQTPILIIVTLRLEAWVTVPEVIGWLAGLERVMPLTRFRLEGLTAEETGELVARLGTAQRPSGSPPAPAFTHWLYQETAGQPFFINETLQALPEQSWTLATLPPKGILPPGVRQVILARLRQLSPVATALLTASAVLGRPCSFERLGQVTGIPEIEALSGLELLLDHHLLRETGEVKRPYTFTHDKIRDVIYTEAGEARRRLYHRRAFEVLEQAQAPAAELAHHAQAAHWVEPAFRYSVAAGEAALRLFAVRDAIVHYEQARAFISQLPSPQADFQPLLSQLYSQLARAYEVVEEPDGVERVCEEMLALAQTAGWPALACAALNRLASIAIYGQQMDQAAALLAQAKQIAEAGADRAGLAQVEWNLGQLTHHINDFPASKAHCERALALAREINDPALIAGASNSLGYALFFLGQVEAAAGVMEEARAGFAALGNRVLEADTLVGLANAYILNGQLEASITAARSAVAIGQELENIFGQTMSRAVLVFGLADRGDHVEAVRLARQNLAAAQTQALAPKLVAGFTAGLAYWATGDYTAAQAVHQELIPFLEEAGVPAYLAQNLGCLCVDVALIGDWAAAHTYARQALSYQDYRALPLFVMPHWPETEALLRGGDFELAREDARRWGELAGNVPRFRIGYLRSLALLAEWEGDPRQAGAYLAEALALAETIGLPGEQKQILAKLEELARL